MKIVLDLGSSLLYLHEEWDQCVVHRDIKPSNVMLDESFGAKLGDFGLARFIDHAVGLKTMTVVSGTPGYVDPQCLITGRASSESDIYSFGVVLLEVACGTKPMSTLDKKKGVFRLAEWVWDLYGQGGVLDAVDQRLGCWLKPCLPPTLNFSWLVLFCNTVSTCIVGQLAVSFSVN
jgi:serine/threonine protein kinase